ncbi:MAG: hypothetical protein EU539_01495 [Promethearchaeota archaeon]|nr:MAG: hypothetical protein EU539_01495 [Candidatus Lokiarchaeota archaeon]
MSISPHVKTSFQSKVSLDGKQEKILVIKCENCPEVDKNFFVTKKCISCFFETLDKHKTIKFNYISSEKIEDVIKFDQISIFINYLNKLNKLRTLNQKVEKLRNSKCRYKNGKCKVFSPTLAIFRVSRELYFNPILFYKNLEKRINLIKLKKNELNSVCKRCVEEIEKNLKKEFDLLKDLDLFKEFRKFKNISINHLAPPSFYESLLTYNYQWLEKEPSFPIISSNQNKDIIDIYQIGNYGLFQISILKVDEEDEKKYLIDLSFDSTLEKNFFKEIVKDSLKDLSIFKIDKVTPLEKLIEIYRIEILKILNLKFNFSTIEKNKISFFASLLKLNLEKIFPLLIDDFIEEIFLDSPFDYVYINHQKYGRCRTELKFNSSEIERIKTFLRLYSGQRLDYLNPSIKHVIKNPYFYCRFAIDVSPLNYHEFSLDIRKLNKNILNIQDLLKNHTLSPDMAAFLYFCILRRVNITTTGETDTGKTTFINALDILTPKEFRKIYIENVIESLNQLTFNKHQVKYKVDSINNFENPKYSKSNQIKTLLHRSPDLIYLGEILTKEEAEAMFHCLAAGLRGFQTIHSNDIPSLLNRFLYHFDIDLSCLNDMDLILLMKKDFHKRKLISINEISSNLFNNGQLHKGIFMYDPEKNRWNNLIPLYETNIINKLKRYENLNETKFNTLINIYNSVFEFLYRSKKISNEELVSLFHRISYYSEQSLLSLESFWEKWKKSRCLNA